jgi:hypothetical protein
MPKKRQNDGGEKPSGPSKRVPRRTEIPADRVRHTFPESIPIDDPRKWGTIGVRIVVERVLRSGHGFGDEVLESAGVGRRDVAEHRAEIVSVLRQILAEPDSERGVRRNGAIVLLGELAKEEALPDLQAVLNSPLESRGARGWAALAMGRNTGPKGGEILRKHLDDPSPAVRRRVIKGLELNGAKSALPELIRIARDDTGDETARRALEAVRALEKRYKLKPAGITERKRRERKGGETVPDEESRVRGRPIISRREHKEM